METKHTPELFASAAAFYEKQPTGQYDNEAAHALRCHHELLEALQKVLQWIDDNCETTGFDAVEAQADAAIAKATGAAA